MASKKILLVGGAGYIGNHVFLSLIDNGFSPVIFDNLTNSYKHKIDNLSSYTQQETDFVEGDIKNKDDLESVFKKYSFHSVIHLAALKSVPKSNEEYIEYYQNNISGLINVLEVMKKNNVKKIIFSSSATVYGDDSVSPVSEDMMTSSNNTYGLTKVLGEELIKNICNIDKSWSAIILRYFNPAGSRDINLFKEDPKTPGGNLFPLILDSFKKTPKTFKIFGNDYDTPDGTPIRDFIHVEDLAYAHVLSLEKLLKSSKPYFNVLNIGTGHPQTVLDIVKTFENIIGCNLEIDFTDRRPNDIGSSFADIQLAKKEIGFLPKHDLYSICKSSIN